MNDCLFCKIVSGEIPRWKIYEDGKTFALLTINPVTDGHTLVVPKNHSTNIFDVEPADWAATMETVRKLAPAVEKAMGATGVNIMMNNREHAGQIIDHPHVHIIPRKENDGLEAWTQHEYEDGEADKVRDKIIENL